MRATKKIVVAVDATPLCSFFSGIGRYTLNLINELSRYENIHLALYSNRKINIDLSDLCGVTVHEHYSWRWLPVVIWLQLIFPIAMLRQKPDVIWSPNHRISILALFSSPYVVTVHDLVYLEAGDTMRWKSRVLDRVSIPLAILYAKKIITVSESNKRHILRTFGIASNKICVTKLAAFTRPSFSKKSKKMEDSSRYVLFVGTIEPRKNIPRIIEAFSISTMDLHKDVTLTLVGSVGWGQIDPEVLAETHGVADRVNFLGPLSDEALASQYRNCEFLVFPSLWEGFGLPIVEAMQYGKAVLTSNLASMPEVAGEAGMLVDPRSVSSIALGMERLLDQNTRRPYEEAALVKSREFSWERTAKTTNDLFYETVELSTD